MQALAGEKRAKMLGESDRERKLHDTSTTAEETARVILAGLWQKKKILSSAYNEA